MPATAAVTSVFVTDVASTGQWPLACQYSVMADCRSAALDLLRLRTEEAVTPRMPEKSKPARTPMTAITSSSSRSVKPAEGRERFMGLKVES